MGLSDNERALLTFAMVAENEAGLIQVLHEFSRRPIHFWTHATVMATGLKRADVEAALRPDARLRASGLLHVDTSDFAFPLRTTDLIGDLLQRPDLDEDRLRDAVLPAAPTTDLVAADFAHLGDAYETARAVLRAALERQSPGVNLLLYGPPGTGKTRFAAMLARDLGASLRVAGAGSAEGVSNSGSVRLESLLLGQRLLRDGCSLLLFDELEDVNLDSGRGLVGARESAPTKQWMNRLLENNPVPTLWITNDVERVDQAFLRRFAWSMAFPHLSMRGRARVLSRHLRARDTVDEAEVSALASRFRVEAAVLASAVSNARLLAPDGVVRADSLERLLAPAQRLLLRDRAYGPPTAPVPWTPVGARASVDLPALADRLADWRPSDQAGLTLLFHGPPGTGKTEFAHHLAQRMGRPLLRRRGSDLLDKYVGESEKAIAAAFHEVSQGDAVLVLDEVDGLLRSRAHAERTWEVSLVNELLQQLEACRGVVICTTNAVDDLDPAALRRFVLKVGFEHLDEARAAALFELTLRPLATDAPPLSLRGVGPLAAGDFAAVRRRVIALGSRLSTAGLVEELRAEVRARVGERRRIGWG